MHKGLICIDFAFGQKESFFVVRRRKQNAKHLFPEKPTKRDKKINGSFAMAIKQENLKIAPLHYISLVDFPLELHPYIGLLLSEVCFQHIMRNCSKFE